MFEYHQLRLDDLFKNFLNYPETYSAPAQVRRTIPSGRRKKARFRAPEHDAGQPAGRKCSSVDVDPVR
jgi:hypothetical protein